MPIFFPRRVVEEQIRMQRPCKGCMYLGRDSCDYYLLTGMRRPCPPGKGCTEYQRTSGSNSQRCHKEFMEKALTVTRKLEEVNAGKLYEDGMSDIKISKIAGVSPTSVAAWRHRTGRTPNYYAHGGKNNKIKKEREHERSS